jgi:hypothetical protein
LATHDRELAIKEALLARDTTNRERQHYVAIAHAYRGELRVLMGDISGTVADARAAHGIYASLAAHDTSDAVMQWSLAKSERQDRVIYGSRSSLPVVFRPSKSR